MASSWLNSSTEYQAVQACEDDAKAAELGAANPTQSAAVQQSESTEVNFTQVILVYIWCAAKAAWRTMENLKTWLCWTP